MHLLKRTREEHVLRQKEAMYGQFMGTFMHVCGYGYMGVVFNDLWLCPIGMEEPHVCEVFCLVSESE